MIRALDLFVMFSAGFQVATGIVTENPAYLVSGAILAIVAIVPVRSAVA